MIIKLFKSAVLSCIITGQCIAMNHNQIDDLKNKISTNDKIITSLKEYKENEKIITSLKGYKENNKIVKYYITEEKAGIVTSDNKKLEYATIVFTKALPETIILALFADYARDVLKTKYPNEQFNFYFKPDFIEHINCHYNYENSTGEEIYRDGLTTDKKEKSQLNVTTICEKLSKAEHKFLQVLAEFAKVLKSKNIDKNTYILFILVLSNSLPGEFKAKLPYNLQEGIKFTIELSIKNFSDSNLRFAFNEIKKTETAYEIDVGSLYPITDTKFEKNPEGYDIFTIENNHIYTISNLYHLLYIFRNLSNNKTINKEQITSLSIEFTIFFKKPT